MAEVKVPRSLMREIGHSDVPWSTLQTWYDYVEETNELLWPESVRVFARMRRQDAMVKAVERAITLPIRKTTYRVKPGDARAEVVSRLAENLDLPIDGKEMKSRIRQRGRFTFAEHLRLALLSLWYGHMAFEQVYEIHEGLPRIKKLAERMPLTIARIHTAADGALVGIDQYVHPDQAMANKDAYLFIPENNLVWYANEREGGNWVGTSLLRSVYGAWLLKSRLLRAGAAAIERNSMGVPIMEALDESRHYTDDELHAADTFAQEFRSGERAGGQTGRFHLRLVGVEGALPDARPFIQMLDEYIARNVLAQFIVLGQQGTHGNRSLGQTFLDTFHLACNAIIDQILDTFNQHVVEDWVDAAYGPDEPCPQVIGTPIGNDVAPDVLAQLAAQGLVHADQPLRDFLREQLKLPEEDPADVANKLPPDPTAQPPMQNVPLDANGMPVQGAAPNGVAPGAPPPGAKPDVAMGGLEHIEGYHRTVGGHEQQVKAYFRYADNLGIYKIEVRTSQLGHVVEAHDQNGKLVGELTYEEVNGKQKIRSVRVAAGHEKLAPELAKAAMQVHPNLGHGHDQNNLEAQNLQAQHPVEHLRAQIARGDAPVRINAQRAEGMGLGKPGFAADRGVGTRNDLIDKRERVMVGASDAGRIVAGPDGMYHAHYKDANGNYQEHGKGYKLKRGAVVALRKRHGKDKAAKGGPGDLGPGETQRAKERMDRANADRKAMGIHPIGMDTARRYEQSAERNRRAARPPGAATMNRNLKANMRELKKGERAGKLRMRGDGAFFGEKRIGRVIHEANGKYRAQRMVKRGKYEDLANGQVHWAKASALQALFDDHKQRNGLGNDGKPLFQVGGHVPGGGTASAAMRIAPDPNAPLLQPHHAPARMDGQFAKVGNIEIGKVVRVGVMGDPNKYKAYVKNNQGAYVEHGDFPHRRDALAALERHGRGEAEPPKPAAPPRPVGTPPMPSREANFKATPFYADPKLDRILESKPLDTDGFIGEKPGEGHGVTAPQWGKINDPKRGEIRVVVKTKMPRNEVEAQRFTQDLNERYNLGVDIPRMVQRSDGTPVMAVADGVLGEDYKAKDENVDDMKAISLFDRVFMNGDRHGANYLVQANGHIVAIDNGRMMVHEHEQYSNINMKLKGGNRYGAQQWIALSDKQRASYQAMLADWDKISAEAKVKYPGHNDSPIVNVKTQLNATKRRLEEILTKGGWFI